MNPRPCIVGLVSVVTLLSSTFLAVDTVDVHHTVIHFETGRHTRLAAVDSAQHWHWGDGFLTAYKQSIWAPGSAGDPLKPPCLVRLGRSTDDGLNCFIIVE